MKHPPYEKQLLDSLRSGSVCSYQALGSADNFSAFRCWDPAFEHLTLRGAWAFQFVTPGMQDFFLAFQVFCDIAVLGPDAGWIPDASSRQLSRVGAPPGLSPWTESLSIDLCLRSSVRIEGVAMVRSQLDFHPWLRVDESTRHQVVPSRILPVLHARAPETPLP